MVEKGAIFTRGVMSLVTCLRNIYNIDILRVEEADRVAEFASQGDDGIEPVGNNTIKL